AGRAGRRVGAGLLRAGPLGRPVRAGRRGARGPVGVLRPVAARLPVRPAGVGLAVRDLVAAGAPAPRGPPGGPGRGLTPARPPPTSAPPPSQSRPGPRRRRDR